MDIIKLTELETQVLKVLWDSERALTIQEMTECMSERKLSHASVAQVVKKLLSKGVIEVCEHVLVSNVYARTFRPCLSREEYISQELRRIQETTSSKRRIGAGELFAALVHSSPENDLDENELNELERFIEEKKSEIRNRR